MKKIILKNEMNLYIIKKDTALKHINVMLSDNGLNYERMLLEITFSYESVINKETGKKELQFFGFRFCPMSSYCVELHSKYMKIIENGLKENWKEISKKNANNQE